VALGENGVALSKKKACSKEAGIKKVILRQH
jgi:hypothetical protein